MKADLFKDGNHVAKVEAVVRLCNPRPPDTLLGWEGSFTIAPDDLICSIDDWFGAVGTGMHRLRFKEPIFGTEFVGDILITELSTQADHWAALFVGAGHVSYRQPF